MESRSMDTCLIWTPVNNGQFHLSQNWKISYVFSKNNQLNTDTQIIWTLWHVPLVSLLTRFHCIRLEVAKLLVASLLWLGCVYGSCVGPWVLTLCIPYMTLVSINVISNFCGTKKKSRKWTREICSPKTTYQCNF